MNRRIVLASLVLLAGGALGASLLWTGLSTVQRTHDSLWAAPVSGPPTQACASIESEIHDWQAGLYVDLLAAGAGAFLLAAEVAGGPRKRIPLSDRGYAVRR